MNKKICTCFIGLSFTFCLLGQNVQLKSDADLFKEKTDTSVSEEMQLPDKEIHTRLATIQEMLDRDQKGADLWWYGWIGIYGAATIGQGAVVFFTNNKTIRENMALAAGTSLLGIVGQFITPLKSVNKDIQFERLQNISKEDCLMRLRQAEQMLKDQAEYAKAGKGWQPHALSGAVNITSGLITWLGYKRSIWDGIENFALNTIITEIQIWSQPTRAMKDYNIYINKYNSSNSKNSRKPDFVWYPFVKPGGIGVRIGF